MNLELRKKSLGIDAWPVNSISADLNDLSAPKQVQMEMAPFNVAGPSNLVPQSPQGVFRNPKMPIETPAPQKITPLPSHVPAINAPVNDNTQAVNQVMNDAFKNAEARKQPLTVAAAKAPVIDRTGITEPIYVTNGAMTVQGGGKAGIDGMGDVTRDSAFKGNGTLSVIPSQETDYRGNPVDKFSYLDDGSALGAARAGIARKLGYVPADYNDNYAKYDLIMAQQAAQSQRNEMDNQIEQGKLAIDAPFKQGQLAIGRMQAEGSGQKNMAQGNLFNAQAEYTKLISSPEFLEQQQLTSAIKDAGERKKAEDGLYMKKLTSIGADLTDDNMNLLRGYESDKQRWRQSAAHTFPDTTNGIAWANAFKRYVYADEATRKNLAENDQMTKDMLLYVQNKNPNLLQMPTFPKNFRPAKQLQNNILPINGGEE